MKKVVKEETKKEVKKVVVKKVKSEDVVHYANEGKLKRAKILVAGGSFKKVSDAYDSLGGPYTVGYGIEAK